MLRKHFSPTPPSEDIRSVKRVSLEEELIIVDQSNKQAQTADNCLNEAERLTDLSDALEDLAAIADGIEKPTATELDLIDRCAQMAVAGTDVAPDELLKGPPLAIGTQIATEGWRETSANIWKAIKALVEKIWTAIDTFLKVHVIMPSIFARLQLVLKQLKNRKPELRYGASAEMEVTTGLQYFWNGQRLQRNATEFAAELAKFAKAVDLVYVVNPTRVAALGDQLANAISGWDGDEKSIHTTVAEMVNALSGSFSQTSLPIQMPFKTAEGELMSTTSYEMLGGVYFKLLSYDGADADLTSLDRLRHGGLTMLDGEEPKEDELTFKHGNADLYEKMIDEVSEMLQVAARFNRSGGEMAKLRNAKKKLEQASEKAIKDSASTLASPIDVAYAKSMLNFNVTFARWVQQPVLPFYSKVIGLARTVIMLVAHYNSLHEVVNKEAEQKIINEARNA